MNAVDLKEGRRKGQISLDQLLSSPPSEVMAMFRHELRQYTSNIEMWAWFLSNKELAHKHDRAIEELKQGVEKVRDEYGCLLNYLEKLQVKVIDMSDHIGEIQITGGEWLSRPPAEIMVNFLVELRRVTSSVEGFIALLLLDNISPEEYDQFVVELTRNLKRGHDLYNSVLDYLEKLQEMRQSGDAND
jgi:hypothetical protein